MTTHQAPAGDAIRDAWDRIAPRFDEFTTPLAMAFGESVLRGLGVGPGTRFLDVAAGSGALALPAARLGAEVVATDLAPAMIDLLSRRADAEGLDITARVMDGEALDLPDAEFDVVASQNGVSCIPRLPAALAEMARVTRPGGRVVVIAFGPPPRAEFLGWFLAALHAAVPSFPGLPTDPPPVPFQLADRDHFAASLTAAGLDGVTVTPATWRMHFHSAAHVWDTATSSNPIGAGLVAGLTPDQVTAAHEVLDRMLRERSGGTPGAVLETAVNVGVGTR